MTTPNQSVACAFCGAPTTPPPSESAKYAHLVTHLMGPDKNVIEIGSGGWPVVPHALQVELNLQQFQHYTSGQHRPPVQWRLPHCDLMRGIGFELPLKDDMADCLYSSHFIEDVPREFTIHLLKEWRRVLKPGGLMIILHPDREIWNYCIRHLGQPSNNEHRAERMAGELGEIGKQAGLKVLKDENTHLWDNDYGLIAIFQK